MNGVHCAIIDEKLVYPSPHTAFLLTDLSPGKNDNKKSREIQPADLDPAFFCLSVSHKVHGIINRTEGRHLQQGTGNSMTNHPARNRNRGQKIPNIIPDLRIAKFLPRLFARLYEDRTSSPLISIASAAISSKRSMKNTRAAKVRTTPLIVPATIPANIMVI